MASADLVQTNGLGVPLASAMKRLIALCSWTAPNLIQPSRRNPGPCGSLSQEGRIFDGGFYGALTGYR